MKIFATARFSHHPATKHHSSPNHSSSFNSLNVHFLYTKPIDGYMTSTNYVSNIMSNNEKGFLAPKCVSESVKLAASYLSHVHHLLLLQSTKYLLGMNTYSKSCTHVEHFINVQEELIKQSILNIVFKAWIHLDEKGTLWNKLTLIFLDKSLSYV